MNASEQLTHYQASFDAEFKDRYNAVNLKGKMIAQDILKKLALSIERFGAKAFPLSDKQVALIESVIAEQQVVNIAAHEAFVTEMAALNAQREPSPEAAIETKVKSEAWAQRYIDEGNARKEIREATEVAIYSVAGVDADRYLSSYEDRRTWSQDFIWQAEHERDEATDPRLYMYSSWMHLDR